MRKMMVLGVRVSVPGNEVVVVLGEPGGVVVLPIVIGPREGAAIASAQAGLVPPRPLTHDLLVSILDRLGIKVVEVRVTHVLHGIFHAEIVLEGGVIIDARPSDAIAIALRSHSPVLCEESLLALAGVPIEEAGLDVEDKDAPQAPAEPPAALMEEFRTFLEDLEPEDFGEPEAHHDTGADPGEHSAGTERGAAPDDPDDRPEDDPGGGRRPA